MSLSKYSSLLVFVFISFNLAAQKAIHLDRQVNSEYEEREPILSHDGRTLYFWRRATPGNTGGFPDPGDIWFSKKLGDGSWTSAVRIGPPLNTIGHDFVWHISPNNDTIWINQVGPGGNEIGLKYAVKSRYGAWLPPKEGHIENFVYEGHYKDFFIGPNKIMLLPNEKSNGYGGTDIYVCFPSGATSWSTPINLGPTINTPGDDDAPFLASDGITMYFNSNGHGGKGDHDIFVSTRLDDSWQNWTEPVSLGYPINTAGYDFDFILSADGEYAYWGSEMNTFGNNDIFSLSLNSCELTVYPEGHHTVCEGEEFVLEAGFSNEEGVKYQWKKDGVIIPRAKKRQLLITEAGTYSLLRMRPKCVSESEPQIIRFIQGPKAEVKSYSEIICLDDSIRLRTINKIGDRYQWQKNGLDIPMAKRSIYWVKTPGKYTVKVSNGVCEISSKPIQLRRFQTPTIFQASDTLKNAPLIIPQWSWSNKLEPKKGTEYIKDLAVAPDGSSYVMSLEEDKRGRITEHITKYFPEGPYRFAMPERKTKDLSHRYMQVDTEGNLLIARNEMYLSKHKPDGRLLWRIDQSIDKINGVTTDEIGNVYTLARYRDTVYFEGQPYPATKRGSMMLSKHDPYGKLIWIKTMSVDWYKYDFGNAVHTDCAGNVYIAGGFSSIANFRKKILRGALKGYSYFVAKYNTEGEFQWANRIVTDKIGVRTHDHYTDCKGNTYLLANYLIQKYDKTGKLLFEKKLKAPGLPKTVRIVANELGDLFLAGTTQEKSEFFVGKLDHRGNQVSLWNTRGASEQLDDLAVIDRDARGNIYVAGITKSAETPPGTMLATKRKSLGFIAKYGKRKPFAKSETLKICEGETTTLMTRAEKGIQYQWLRNEQPIEGATAHFYEVSQSGDYRLRSIASPCERLSPIQSVEIDCGGRKPAIKSKPPMASLSTPAIKSELDRNASGQAVRLRKRRIKQQGEFVVSNPVVAIYVWDHGADDQDTVSVNINGIWVLENYRLQKKRKKIEFTLDPNNPHNVIVLYAHNLGRVPPNTASIMVDDGINQHTTRLRSNLHSSGSINIQLGGSSGSRRK